MDVTLSKTFKVVISKQEIEAALIKLIKTAHNLDTKKVVFKLEEVVVNTNHLNEGGTVETKFVGAVCTGNLKEDL